MRTPVALRPEFAAVAGNGGAAQRTLQEALRHRCATIPRSPIERPAFSVARSQLPHFRGVSKHGDAREQWLLGPRPLETRRNKKVSI